MSTPDAASDPSVTWVITHQIRAERRADFETWAGGIIDAVSGFPGHQGVTVLRPGTKGDTEYVLVVRFAA